MSRRRRDRHATPADDAFVCAACGTFVSGQAPGTGHRNHCSSCLASLHVDMKPGDRLSGCRGLMRPIAIEVKRNGEWAVVHRCETCGVVRANRTAGDDSELALVSIAVKPLALLPFPVSDLAALAKRR